MNFEQWVETVVDPALTYRSEPYIRVMRLAWNASRSEALKEAAEIARKIGEESGPQNERAVTARRIAEEIEAKMK